MNRLVTVALLACVVATLAGCGTGSGSVTDYELNPAAGPSSSPAGDPASLLASRDGASDAGPYSAALDALQPRCTQDRVGIAGLGDAGYSDLTSHGIVNENRLAVLQHLAQSIPNIGKIDCQGVLAAYLTLREGH